MAARNANNIYEMRRPDAKAKMPRATRGAELFSTMEHVPLAFDTASEAASPFSSMGALVAESPSSRSLNLMAFPWSANTTPEMPQAGNHFKPRPVALIPPIHGPSTIGHIFAEASGSQPVRMQRPLNMPNMTLSPMPQAQQQVNWYSPRMVPPAEYSYNNSAMQRVSNEASGLQSHHAYDYQHNTNPATQQAEAQPFYAEPEFQTHSAIPKPQPVVVGTQTDAGRCPNIDFSSAESAGSSANYPFEAGDHFFSIPLAAQASGFHTLDTPRYSHDATLATRQGPDEYYFPLQSQPRALYNQTVDSPSTAMDLLVAETSVLLQSLDLQSSLYTTPALPRPIDIINANLLRIFPPSVPVAQVQKTPALARPEDNLNVLNYGNGDSDHSLVSILSADRTLNFGPADPFANTSFDLNCSRSNGKLDVRAGA